MENIKYYWQVREGCEEVDQFEDKIGLTIEKFDDLHDECKNVTKVTLISLWEAENSHEDKTETNLFRCDVVFSFSI